uniref:Uncharacterized protein n=1 Tax=Oryza brachyantha TaxID=4533 RepID=J3MJ91_ORYBR
MPALLIGGNVYSTKELLERKSWCKELMISTKCCKGSLSQERNVRRAVMLRKAAHINQRHKRERSQELGPTITRVIFR